ncbi:lysophospholipid acyltransferase family protein [soil metagenome]
MSRPSTAQDFVWRAEVLLYDALTALLRLFPVDWVSAAGGAIFKAVGPLTSTHRVASDNIRIAFPELTEAEHKALLRAQWDNVGRYFFEFPMTDRLTPATGRVEVVGRERLEAIARSGEGAILVSGHFSNFEVMAAAIVDAGVRCRVTYRAANNPYFDTRIVRTRASYGVELFGPKGGGEGGRELLATLKDGFAVSFLNDQKFNTGVEAPFFGEPCRTAGGPTRMALRFGAALHPMSVVRLKGARFRVTAHEAIPLEVTGDREADLKAGVAKLNAFFEARVRERPAEWFWVHKRWPYEAYAALRAKAQA